MDKKLVTIENGNIQIANEFMTEWKAFQEQKELMELREQKIKQAILEAMEANGIKSYENDFIKMTYVEATTRKSVDTKALKEQGLYDAFTKETPVKASVKLTWKQ